MMGDTIFALATARGKAGVAIIRVSGPDAFRVAARFTDNLPGPREAALRTFHRLDGTVLDTGLMLLFEAGSSFTGENIVEFQIHGSLAVIRALLADLETCEGCRLAEPGEFTRRALENDRLDLTDVEGLADLIDAESEAQRRQAVRTLSGSFGQTVDKLRQRLIEAQAFLVTAIDFSDEDIPENLVDSAIAALEDVKRHIENEVDGSHKAERLRAGFEVAIIGAPNVGKSTLLNAIVRRDVAITSELAGTTRDIIEAPVDLNGIPITFLDTAGLRDSSEAIEKLGIDRARHRADTADLRVFLGDVTSDMPARQPGDIEVNSKADLRADSSGVSGLTGHGLSELLENIATELATRVDSIGTATTQRHRMGLLAAHHAVKNAIAGLKSDRSDLEFASEDIRHAMQELENLTGKVDIETILTHIFSSFCLGK